MSVRRVQLAADGVRALAAELSPPPPDPQIAAQVAAIIADVRDRGDGALVEFVRRFDCETFTESQIRVGDKAIADAVARLDPTVRDAILVAAAQVRGLAQVARPADVVAHLEFGQHITVRQIPVASAGLYVPGGRAAYPSTVVMAVVPAQVAGVERIAIVTPTTSDGTAHEVILAAAGLLGIDEVYAVGGPGSIAALAFGTETIAPVSVIAGPGSAWVQEAKRQVYGTVGIDGIAGPSELVIVADVTANPDEVAADLLGQAEHGADSPAMLISADATVVDRVEEALSALRADGTVTLVTCPDLEVALDFAEMFAPEHLQLQIADAVRVAGRVRQAGAVFVGANGGTAFGDYVAGSNHILPTGGAARFASSVSPATFMRRMAVIDLPDAAVTALTPHLAAIADSEGFPNHRRSAQVRATRIAREGDSR
jgi:histidinol dehydrogenase